MTSVNALDLPDRIKDILIKASLDTVEDLLLYTPPFEVNKPGTISVSPVTIASRGLLKDLTTQEINLVYEVASAFVVQDRIRLNTAWDLLHQEAWLSFGDSILDQAIGGRGLAAGSITEIAGESATGKTQLCLQLSLMVQLPVDRGGLNGSAVWLSTEGRFPYVRLENMLSHFLQRYGGGDSSDESEDESTKQENRANGTPSTGDADRLTARNIRDNIHYDAMSDQVAQLHTFNYHLPLLVERSHNVERSPKGQKPVRLIIIDSITNNFRSELTIPRTNSNNNGSIPNMTMQHEPEGFRLSLLQRSSDLCEIGLKLRNLAVKYNLCVVCVNQVTDKFSLSDNPAFMQQRLAAMGMDKKPALGLVWENTVNSRIMLHRTRLADVGVNYTQAEGPTPALTLTTEPRRSLTVMFSPWAENRSLIDSDAFSGFCQYTIREHGVVGIESA